MATSSTPDDGPIAQVREDMTVIDAAGEEIGTVALVQMGDPEAVTPAGQESNRGGPLRAVAEALVGEPRVSEQAAAQLARLGYVKVDAKGIGGDVYASSEQVAEVSGDTVRLTVAQDQLYS